MLLFVCSGNTCRSPMCEGYMRHMFEQAGMNDIKVVSAGTSAGLGQPASQGSIGALKRYGVDISAHRSRPLDAELLNEADMIVAMTSSHKLRIGAISAEALKKTSLLMDYAGGGDVADPYGGNQDVYFGCFDEMKFALDNLFLEIYRENKKKN